MRHRKTGRILGRNSAHRKAMFRNMVTSLLEHGRIRTTEAKAKELRRMVEKTITKAVRVHGLVSKDEGARSQAEKVQLVHAMRMAGRMVRDKAVISRLFGELSGRFQNRPGGYTRIIKAGPRPGDAAAMAVVELVE